jgi:hypothetical protein
MAAITSNSTDRDNDGVRPKQGLAVRPLPALAKTIAMRRLAETLEQRGHHPSAAQAIAVAVCDPASVRRQLEQPGELRVAGGTLELIYTSVWAPAALIYPTNARTLPAFSYPIEERGGRRIPLQKPVVAADDARELTMSVRDRAELVGALDLELGYLRDHNDLFSSISEHGVREPLTLIPLMIEFGSRAHDKLRSTGPGSTSHDSSLCLLAAVDGSSRVAAVYQAQELEPNEVVFHLGGNDRLLRQRVQRVLALLTQDVQDLETEDLARLRTLVLPAAIIVGFRPDPDSQMDLSGAIDSRLGSLHIDPPKEWSTASRIDVQADTVLQLLIDKGRITESEGEWLAGRLTADEATALGFPRWPDVRAARLLQVVQKYKRTVGDALRSLVSRRVTVRMQDRIDVAAEAALRPFRSQLSDAAASAARNVLQTTFAMPELAQPWQAHLEPRKANEVCEAALLELREDGRPGPVARELLVLGLYWMSRYGLIRKTTRGGETDRRNISEVLTQMVYTEHGIRLLHRIVLDGRAGRVPRRIDGDGKFVLSADGDYLPVTERWMRASWPSDSVSDSSRNGSEDSVMSPEADLMHHQAQLRTRVSDLAAAVRGLEQPVDQSGTPIVKAQGLATNYVDELLSILFEVSGQLSLYRQLSIGQSEPEPPTD